LAELNLRATGATINASQSVSLGNAYNTSIFGANDGDLQMTFGLVGGIQITGSVEYVTGGVAGDYDGDSDVDGADFLRWQRGQSPTPLSAGDLATWRTNFGTGGAVAAAGAVPEPASAALVALAAAGLLVSRRRN
jgi:hypothetical protein